jgi:hypothetical protein
VSTVENSSSAGVDEASNVGLGEADNPFLRVGQLPMFGASGPPPRMGLPLPSPPQLAGPQGFGFE